MILGESRGVEIQAIVKRILPTGRRLVQFTAPQGMHLEEALNKAGQVPLPPYIHRSPSDKDQERYQTVFASRGYAVAAPTAGLHFTNKMLSELKEKGIDTAYLTLNVGPGTFKPVKTQRVEEHQMEEEFFTIPYQTAQKVNRAKRKGIPVIAVGTTVTRALESAADQSGEVTAASRWTNLFIYPGYRFKVVDHLITNFHLPRSTLLMLVCALGGRELILKAYHRAIEEEFKVYSYGDAMLVL
jgi:S-adenosylmethionine:tRNA ribosyltransferase-isomerase